MKNIWKWCNELSNRIKTSINLTAVIIGLISTVMSVLGVSLNGWTHRLWLSLIIILVVSIGLYLLVYWIIGLIFKDSVSLTIRHTSVSISCGNIFEVDGFKVIGCDTHFDTRVDDIIISKKSLHGQLILDHGNKNEIDRLVEEKAKELNLEKNADGLYSFPLGTVIRYNSSKDQKTYLMLAMTELRKEGDKYKSYTTMAKFEHMLMHMWNEIDGLYASNDVILPLLGMGISRFEDGPKNNEALLRCMLCTLNSSGVTLNSKVKVVIFGDANGIPLYEYKYMFRSFQRR